MNRTGVNSDTYWRNSQLNAGSNIETKREIFYSRKVLPFVFRLAFVTTRMEAAQALAEKKNDRLSAKDWYGQKQTEHEAQ
jgi:hypothetical protein